MQLCESTISRSIFLKIRKTTVFSVAVLLCNTGQTVSVECLRSRATGITVIFSFIFLWLIRSNTDFPAARAIDLVSWVIVVIDGLQNSVRETLSKPTTFTSSGTR